MNFILILLAGLMNGSFTIPTKYIKNINHERIWKYHSIIGLVIIPWLFLLCFMPNYVNYYSQLQKTTLILLIVSGGIFGLGQICFSYAIEKIGIAQSFATNLGIGISIGSLFVIVLHRTLFTWSGLIVIVSIFLVILSLIFSFFSQKKIQSNLNKTVNSYSIYLAWGLAVIAGFASGLQNIAFMVTINHANTTTKLSNSFWIWPIYLSTAAVSMYFYFQYKNKKKYSNNYLKITKNKKIFTIKNFLLIISMGIFFTGSLFLYSKGVDQMKNNQVIIAWPTFMIAIILSTQAWGKFLSRHTQNDFTSKLQIISPALLMIAIILLSTIVI